jgi:hypothetical protein
MTRGVALEGRAPKARALKRDSPEENAMKKQLALAFAFSLGLCASAYAGLKLGYSVTINDYGTYQHVYGTMGRVRNTADTVQWMSCDVSTSGTTTPSTTAVNCSARNTAGTFFTCYNRWNVEMRQIVAGIDEGSHVSWQTDPTDNTRCSYIYVVHGSQYEPKAP